MTGTELVKELITAVHANNTERVLQLLSATMDYEEPVADLHYVEALFWIRNGELNRARLALHKELRHFPQNRNAAKAFTFLQPASKNSFENQNFAGLLQSIEYLQDGYID